MKTGSRVQALMQVSLRALSSLLLGFSLLSPTLTSAADLYDATAIPHISKKARDSYYQLFLNSAPHRAFAIAPGGAWAWVADKVSQEAATQEALQSCTQQTEQTCVVYTLDGEVTFDREQWKQLWGPYLSPELAAKAKLGITRGSRFPDLAFSTADGERTSVSDLKGKVVMLHFWGSWCPPCLRELPSLELFQRILSDRVGDKVALVLLQAREPIADSRAWLKQQGIEGLPLFDSGATSSDDAHFTTKSGIEIPDRKIAKVFPSTYVLDRNGVILFSHIGAIMDWTEYLPFFEESVQ